MLPVRSSSDWQRVFARPAGSGRPQPPLTGRDLDPYFEATVDAAEEAVLDALLAATTTTGVGGRTVNAVPHDALRALVVG